MIESPTTAHHHGGKRRISPEGWVRDRLQMDSWQGEETAPEVQRAKQTATLAASSAVASGHERMFVAESPRS